MQNISQRLHSASHEENALKNFHVLNNAKQFAKAVRFSLNLEDLYSVVASCNYN
jgi:hypothetical protein